MIKNKMWFSIPARMNAAVQAAIATIIEQVIAELKVGPLAHLPQVATPRMPPGLRMR